jgi:hypothetical protein
MSPASRSVLRRTGLAAAVALAYYASARAGLSLAFAAEALKLARHGFGADAERRYIEEARRLERVKHPNVVVVHGADVHDGRVGLWTDLVEGTLEAALEAGGPFGAREAALVGLDLCRALSAVHAQGLVHGDVKTSNVMRERGGRIVLMDFGTVKEMTPGGEAVMTRGTPVALAPELLRGEAITPEADVYSLGVLLYRLVSGRYPVEAASALDAAAQHARGGGASLRDLRPDLPEPFLHAVERCLRANPRERYQTPGELTAPLRETLGISAEVAHGARPVRPAWRIAVFMRGAFSLTGIADLVVVDRAGRATTLIENGPGALGLAWSPDGQELWFATPPTVEVGEVEAVSLSGRRRTLARVLGAHAVLDVFKDGRALVAPTDVRGGLACARAGAAERDLSWLENDWADDLSADGSRVLVFQNFAAGGPGGGVYVRRTAGSPAVRLGDGRPEALSPDGQWVLATTHNEGGEWMLLPTGAGPARPLGRGAVQTIVEADWLGDGSGIVISGRDAAGATRVYILDLASGALRPLLGEVTLPENAVTGDGRHFLGSEQGQWFLYAAGDGARRPLPHLRPDDAPLQWSPDGRAIFVRRGGRNDPPPIAIERIDAATGQRSPVHMLAPRDPVGTIRLQPVLLQPDGSAYCSTYQRLRSDIYLATGLR